MYKFALVLLVVVLAGCQQLALEASKRFSVNLNPDSLTVARERQRRHDQRQY